MKLSSHDFVAFDQRPFRPAAAPAEVATQYGDAELYRLIVARAMHEGRARTKEEFDSEVRTLGTINAADKLIELRTARPECTAWRRGKQMICECGAKWLVDADPSKCGNRNRREVRS